MFGQLCLAIATSMGAVEAGWQPLDGGGLEYIVRVDPQSEKELATGLSHEIEADASDIRRVLVFIGQAQLPRIHATGAAKKSAARDPKVAIQVSAKSVDQLRTEGVLIEVPEDQRNAGRIEISVGDKRQDEPTPSAASKGEGAGTPAKNPFEKKNPFDKSNEPSGADVSRNKSDNNTGPELKGQNAPFPPNDSEPPAKESAKTQSDTNVGKPRPSWLGGSEAKKAAEVQTASHAQGNQSKGAQFEASPSDPEARPESNVSIAERDAEEPSRPWLPLTAALLALFASLGGNLYLAWLNHDSRTRYRRLLNRMQEPAVTER